MSKFNELVEVAVQAAMIGLITIKQINDEGVRGVTANGRGVVGVNLQYSNVQEIEEEIAFIRSLYKKSFTISAPRDLMAIQPGAKVTLANGRRGVFKMSAGVMYLEAEDTGETFTELSLFWLEGAEVQQP